MIGNGKNKINSGLRSPIWWISSAILNMKVNGIVDWLIDLLIDLLSNICSWYPDNTNPVFWWWLFGNGKYNNELKVSFDEYHPAISNI